MEHITTIKAQDHMIEVLSTYLRAYKVGENWRFVEDNTLKNAALLIRGENKQEIRLDFPFRLGRFLDLLTEKNAVRFLDFGACRLDLIDHVFIKADETQIILTEKEVSILEYLSGLREERVSRADLLHAVWNYAEDAETHTIETHIYRLRQKIENDPSKPVILMTDSKGYYVI